LVAAALLGGFAGAHLALRPARTSPPLTRVAAL
jgi:hypothetical protein